MPNVSPVEPQTTAVFAYTVRMCGTMAVERQGTPEAHFTFRRYITNVQGTPWVGTKPHMCSAVKKLYHFNGGTENLNLVKPFTYINV
jgi:hypothetical protein